MIQNMRQYLVTKKQIKTLSAALSPRPERPAMDPRLYNAMVAGIRSQIGDLKKEVREFEKLQSATRLHMPPPATSPAC